jgi:hypothetical protein
MPSTRLFAVTAFVAVAVATASTFQSPAAGCSTDPGRVPGAHASDRGVLVGEPPHLWWMTDTNHDLKADTKELVADGFGRRDANVEHNANTLLWAAPRQGEAAGAVALWRQRS